jgi:hypothetical protein
MLVGTAAPADQPAAVVLTVGGRRARHPASQQRPGSGSATEETSGRPALLATVSASSRLGRDARQPRTREGRPGAGAGANVERRRGGPARGRRSREKSSVVSSSARRPTRASPFLCCYPLNEAEQSPHPGSGSAGAVLAGIAAGGAGPNREMDGSRRAERGPLPAAAGGERASDRMRCCPGMQIPPWDRHQTPPCHRAGPRADRQVREPRVTPPGGANASSPLAAASTRAAAAGDSL